MNLLQAKSGPMMTRFFVKGKGDILVQTEKGAKRVSNIFYVPGLKHNLLSVDQFLLRGFHVHFNELCVRSRTSTIPLF